MRALILFVVLIATGFFIKSFYEPTTAAQIAKESNDKVVKAKLGLVHKKRITKNIVDEATVWEELHRVEGGSITFRTSVHEYMPGKFTTSIKVKHKDLNGNTIYSRTAYSQSKSITIYRYGKNGKGNGTATVIDFIKAPTDQCLRNRFKLVDMPKSCRATVKVFGVSMILRLKMMPSTAILYDAKGKAFKRLKAMDTGYIQQIKAHLKKVYEEAKIVKKLKEPRI